MKYAEYQVWFHTFTTCYAALCRQNHDPADILRYANRAADTALDKFKEVKDIPKAPSLGDIDLEKMVQNIQNLSKK